METLAYLHTACAYEDSEAAELTLDIDRFNFKQLSSQAGLLMLHLLVPVAIVAAAGHASALQVGDRGPSVTVLQDRLRAAGYFNRSSTGIYSTITQSAVRRFQASRGLSVDGIAGVATQRALRGQSYAASGNIRPISSTSRLGCTGSSGVSVRELQRQLNDRGYAVGIDGIFGSGTCRALRQFQADNGLVVDGIPGPATRQALRGQSYAADNIRPISSTTSSNTVYRPISAGSASDVRSLQQRLNDRGYAVRVDGIFGPETERAVRQFQADYGLRVDGIPGPATRTALGLSPSPDDVLPSASVRKQYVVVVPAQGSATLSQVRAVFPGARYSASNLGKYVWAGAFDERGYAEARASLLRANKLDAQVRYF